MCEICCLMLTMKTPEVTPCSSVCSVNFEHVIAGWNKAFRNKKNVNAARNNLRSHFDVQVR